MTPVPGAEDDGFWYEAEIDKLAGIQMFLAFDIAWAYSDVFASGREAFVAAKNSDRTAQRLLKETYERYIVAKLTR